MSTLRPAFVSIVKGVSMSTLSQTARLLLLTSALALPGAAFAQSGAPTTPTGPINPAPLETPQSTTVPPSSSPGTPVESVPDAAADSPTEEAPDISIPGGGGDIVVVGRRAQNPERTASQVVSVLSTADIARTGEGSIAGALSRVTGLSVVGNGFVYVRGLGDRYSLALLNGSPLPSPEPLRRVVPLDLFPTNVIASSLVQKSYSANFPGEFGGGVINLTTTAAPKESFLTISAGAGGDSQTTARLGYTYFGSSTDWTGFDNGNRDNPPALRDFFASGARIGDGTVDTQAIAAQLVNARNGVLQRINQLPANFSGSVTGGTSFDVAGATLGIIATGGISNRWLTRQTTQQTPSTADLSQKELDFQRVITDNRVVVNGLIGLGLEFGENRVRLTNLFIRDTLKQARLGVGSETTTGFTRQDQDTAWFDRQLFDTQLTGEFKFGDLSVDLRGGYAGTHRNSPNELSVGYIRSNRPNDPFGDLFVNRLNNGQQGSASIAYSRLTEDLYSGGLDLSYRVLPNVSVTIGYAGSYTDRYSERRQFSFIAPGTLPLGVDLLRPDLLLGGSVINAFDIALIETTETDPAFTATLETHAGYGMVQAKLFDSLDVNLGVRYEKAVQAVDPAQVFATPTNSLASTALRNDYFLPAATLTYQVAPEMQFRINASKTIARPQFRELIFQQYYDPETNRQFRGNPLLQDSQLYNAEARYEWYFAREQRVSIAGFFKRIENPIEAFTGFSDNQPQTSFANAPKANLYGAEAEAQKYFDLSTLGGEFFSTRRGVLIANYTFTKSEIKVDAGDLVTVFGTTAQPASNFFRDGAPLTGQSDHLVNLQVGLEDTSRLSQQTFLLTYASKRVTSRGAVGLPDIIEKPGIRLDFVAREAVPFMGLDTSVKFEVRNITGTKYQEFQEVGANRNYYNLYDLGTTFNLGVGLTF